MMCMKKSLPTQARLGRSPVISGLVLHAPVAGVYVKISLFSKREIIYVYKSLVRKLTFVMAQNSLVSYLRYSKNLQP